MRVALTVLFVLSTTLVTSTWAADEDEDGGPIVLDVRQGTRNADGSYSLPSPINVGEDGSLQFSNGKKMSMKQAMEQHISSGNARGPDGQRIDPNSVIVNDDGSISRKDGSLISKPATGTNADVGVTQHSGSGAEADDKDSNEEEPAQVASAPVRSRPASAVGGIELISGGGSKDGIATVGEIPVLR